MAETGCGCAVIVLAVWLIVGLITLNMPMLLCLLIVAVIFYCIGRSRK